MTRKFNLSDLTEASRDYAGFCRACGYLQEPVEPDACNYKCEECGEPEVFGADELILMGEVEDA